MVGTRSSQIIYHITRFAMPLAAVLALLMPVMALAAGNAPFMEQNTHRWGGDYSSIEMPRGNPRQCHAACAQDSQCLAWSFIRAGHQGAASVCELKSTVPHAKESPCCVSGVTIGAGASRR